MAVDPTAGTTSAQMIVPEVWGDMVQAEFEGRLVWGALAFSDNTLQGQPGDTIHFPSFNALTDAVEVTENQDLPLERLTTADDTATIKEAGKAVEITTRARLVGYGDPYAEARRQLGIVVARKIDADLQADAYASAGVDGTIAAASFSENTLFDMLDAFGEDGADPSNFSAFILSSARHSVLRRSDFFNSADVVGQGNQGNVRGYVGNFSGVPVVVSDRAGTQVTLIQPQSLGLLYKQRPVVETDRDILARTDLISTFVHYGTKVVRPEGVAVYTQL